MFGQSIKCVLGMVLLTEFQRWSDIFTVCFQILATTPRRWEERIGIVPSENVTDLLSYRDSAVSLE